MVHFTEDFLYFLIFFCFSVILSCVIFLASYLIAVQKSNTEKATVYECGFDPFDDARGRFDIRFYLVAILFLIFDLEIIFLFPWTIVFSYLSFFGYFSIFLFLFLLTLGFIYEWQKGALEWE